MPIDDGCGMPDPATVQCLPAAPDLSARRRFANSHENIAGYWTTPAGCRFADSIKSAGCGNNSNQKPEKPKGGSAFPTPAAEVARPHIPASQTRQSPIADSSCNERRDALTAVILMPGSGNSIESHPHSDTFLMPICRCWIQNRYAANRPTFQSVSRCVPGKRGTGVQSDPDGPGTLRNVAA